MRDIVKFISLLLAIQAVCLGAGLWVQHRFEAWSLRQSVVNGAFLELAEQAEQIIDRSVNTAQTASATREDELQRIMTLAATRTVACLLVDSEYRVVASSRGDGDVQVPPSPGQPLHATPSTATRPSAVGVEWIELKQPDGTHIAAALTLPNSGYKLITHEPKAHALDRAAALARPLTVIQWQSLGWIIALLSVALYTVMYRYVGHLVRERRRTGGRYLRHGDAVVRTRDAVIFGLAKLAESRDPDTGHHLERITTYCKMLAKAAQRDGRFADQITPVFVRNISLSSALHDIGKVGVQDGILLKRGPLTADERLHMQSHVAIGGQCLRDIERRLGGSNFLQMAREIALCHHECWDGSGYPEKLRGTAIPLSARIVAIADFYDALSMRRVYKEAFPHDVCKAMIGKEAGRRFDPDLVDIWMTIEHRFAAVADHFCTADDKDRDGKESTAQQAELQWSATLVAGAS